MKRQNVRVILASDYPEVRYFLKEVVEEAGAVIVGQAGNATRALTLARTLRPDVALIDYHLPHVIGLDSVPMSRIGGLDTAQTISQEIPNTQAVLINNAEVLSKNALSADAFSLLYHDITGANIPFTLRPLSQTEKQQSTLVFANIEERQEATPWQKIARVSDRAILFGGLSTMAGLGLMLTIILAGAGIVLAAAGVGTMLLGLGGKLATSLWHPARLDKS